MSIHASKSLTGAIESASNWLGSQLSQSNRAPLVLGALIALIVVMGLSAVAGLSNGAIKGLRASQQELSRLKQELASGYWSERKQASATLRFQLRERLWTAETAGLAEASLERWLRERLEGKGVRVDSIRVQRTPISAASDSSDPSALENVQRMTAKVIMPLELEVLFELLDAVSTSDKIMVVDRLIIRTGRNSLVEMDVSTFVYLSAAQD
ncbi:MAG: hypothetical protein SFV19_08115 [Rhodospirillaceae bacterium]|nr:hypothetical protein [Rhodospirillaceae bacterium]